MCIISSTCKFWLFIFIKKTFTRFWYRIQRSRGIGFAAVYEVADGWLSHGRRRDRTDRSSFQTVCNLNTTVFWNVAPCSLVEIYRRFRGDYWVHRHPSPWWWRQQALLKRRSISTRLHGATSQKTVIFMLASLRTWNLTFCNLPTTVWGSSSGVQGQVPTSVDTSETVWKERAQLTMCSVKVTVMERENEKTNTWCSMLGSTFLQSHGFCVCYSRNAGSVCESPRQT
jgi:hypothetical protein